MNNPPTPRRRVAVILAVLTLGVLAVGGWATSRGFIPPLTGVTCAGPGYDPVPSYETLVNDYDMSPYCARTTRDEAWF